MRQAPALAHVLVPLGLVRLLSCFAGPEEALQTVAHVDVGVGLGRMARLAEPSTAQWVPVSPALGFGVSGLAYS